MAILFIARVCCCSSVGCGCPGAGGGALRASIRFSRSEMFFIISLCKSPVLFRVRNHLVKSLAIFLLVSKPYVSPPNDIVGSVGTEGVPSCATSDVSGVVGTEGSPSCATSDVIGVVGRGSNLFSGISSCTTCGVIGGTALGSGGFFALCAANFSASRDSNSLFFCCSAAL